MNHIAPVLKISAIFRGVFFAVFYLVLCSPVVVQAQKTPLLQHVLIVHSAYEEYPWTISLNRGIRDVFAAAPESFEFNTEYLDTKRNHEQSYFEKLYSLWQFKYRNRHIDLIIACDNEAYDFIVNGRDGLFKDIPLVFAAYIGYTPSLLEGKENITGVTQETDIVATIDIALMLHPRTKKVVFVAPGAPPFRMAWLKGLPTRYENRAELVTITPTDLSAIDTEIASLGPDIVVIPLNSCLDENGTYLPFNKFVSHLATNAVYPVYALWDIALDQGIVGGKMVSGELQGRAAAKLALQVLRGTPVRNLPVVTHSPNQYMFDWNQLQRFKVNLSDIPENAVVIHQPVSFYSIHKGVVLGTVGGIAVLLLFIIVLGIVVASLKRTKKNLLLSDEILKQMPEGVVLTDLDGKIKRWMGQAEHIFGYTTAEALDQPFYFIYPPENRAEIIDRYEESIHNIGSFSGEILCRKKDSTTVPIEITSSILLDQDRRSICIVAIHKDISERKQAEKALCESEIRFKKMIEKSPLPMIITDQKQNILLFNDKFTELFGYTIDDVSKVNEWRKMAYPDEQYRVAVNQTWRDAISEAKTNNTDIEMQSFDLTTKDNTKRSCEFYMVPLNSFSLIIIIDVTERKKIETDIKRLALAMDHSSDTIFITDIEGKIVYANPAFEKISGYSREEILGEKIGALEGAHDRSVYEAIWESLSRGDIWTGQMCNTKKNGATYTEEATISPVFSSKGKIINYVAVKRDITERIKLEIKIRQSQRMEAIGTLAGGIAHDFNNILTAILGFSELALNGVEQKSPIANYLQEILNAGNRAKELVKQILTFARVSKSEVKPVLVGTIAKEVIKFIRSSIPTTIGITQVIQSEAKVVADPAQLHQIFMNLFTNAAHAMEDKGGMLTLTIDERNITPSQQVAGVTLAPGNWVVVRVEDTGIGIPDHALKNIFEPYFTTKKLGKGTGLGLSVVYGAVKAMKGEITVASKPEKGTLFTLYLPKAEEREDSASNRKKTFDYSGDERVLLVDDEVAITSMLKKMFEEEGYSVVAYNNPKEALDYFISNHDSIDLVLTDMTMPYMTGAELAVQLLEIKPELPIICCTGFSKKIDKNKAAKIGIKALLKKPLSRLNIFRAVRNIFDNRE
ncbi:MAG: PAS domain S-box protein [Desulforhopalus sp.]|nr:PAS domain S-box protein [Desulforhopalus sp.]